MNNKDSNADYLSSLITALLFGGQDDKTDDYLRKKHSEIAKEYVRNDEDNNAGTI